MAQTWDILALPKEQEQEQGRPAAVAAMTPVPPFQASFPCDTRLCVAATHILQKEVIEEMTKVVVAALKQQIEGPANPKWLLYFDKHLQPSFDDFPFDPFDKNRLFGEVLKRIHQTPILYVSPRSKCDRRKEAFVRPLEDLLNMLTCENVQKALAGESVDVEQAQIVSVTTSDSGKRVKIVYNLAREPIAPAIFLNMEHCRDTCDDIRRLLLLNPVVHRQLLSQLFDPMPPFLSRGLGKPAARRGQQLQQPQQQGQRRAPTGLADFFKGP